MNCYWGCFANESAKQALIVTIPVTIIRFNFCFDFIFIHLSNEQLLLSHLYYLIFWHCSSAFIFPLPHERSTYFTGKMFDFSILHSVFPSFYPILNFGLSLLFNPFILISEIHYFNDFYLKNVRILILFYYLLSPQLIIIFLLTLVNYFFFIIPVSLIITKEF